MGGTFNPPHIGHLFMAEFVRQEKNLDEIWFIPTGKVPHKETDAKVTAQDRLKMIQLATRDNPYFSVNAVEVESGEYSYTYKTIEFLNKEYPTYDFSFIVGADSLDYMDKWRNPKQIFDSCKIIAVNRKGFSNQEMEEKKSGLIKLYGGCIDIIKMPIMGVSSSDIRDRVKNGNSIKYMVTDSVIEYIKANRLYLD